MRSARDAAFTQSTQRGIESLRKWLEGFWDQALTAFKDAAELEATKEASRRMSDKFEGDTRRRTRSLSK